MKRAKKSEVWDYQEDDFIISKLKDVGLAATKPRLRIFSTFYANNDSELTVNDIYRILQKNKTPVSFSTIYSVLNHLAVSGLLVSYSCISGVKLYELNFEQYPSQLICHKCGARHRFFNQQLLESCIEKVEQSGFESSGFSLSISGVCKTCSSKN